jgi:hypothetical protein
MLPATGIPQKKYQAEGKSEVRLERNKTLEQTRYEAEEKAKLNAIEQVFGSYVEQQTDIRLKEGRVNYDIIGGTRVRGEWIRTTNIKFTEIPRAIKGKEGTEQELWIQCEIKGEVRECISRANIEFYTLNCPLVQCRRTAFYNDEDVFLYFTSPVDGYLSVFLDDGENTFRLLPYKSMGTMSAVRVAGDKPYLFFSRDKELQFDPQYTTDALELYTELEIEYNDIYIVFAESPYTKPILSDVTETDDGYFIPRSLKSKDFQGWLGDCRADMPDFQAVRVRISIER